MFLRLLIPLLLYLALEYYFYQAVALITKDYSINKRLIIKCVYWGITAIMLLTVIAAMITDWTTWPRWIRIYFFGFFLVSILVKLIGVSFLLMDDIIRLFRFIISKFQSSDSVAEDGVKKITRLKFFSYAAVGVTTFLGLGMAYGILKGGYKYKVHRSKINFPNLPPEFDGLKVLQISDMHVGSFPTTDSLEHAFDLIMKENADLIVFTGDLVNNEAGETEGFESTFAKLKAPLGVYSILGNHDYGDYHLPFSENPDAKRANLERLKGVHKAAGWDLLLNENRVFERNGKKIALLGIENKSSHKRFKTYGNMVSTYDGMKEIPFKILLSHDPSHWDSEIVNDYKDIDLTLSGHTHGFQFGIEIPGFIKWSPASLMYKNWAGLYKEKNQYLYVNRGLGFLAYPGRLGIWPEITVLELKSA